MRIDELHLKAFGPFADRRLDFSNGAEGLHVVFGPNEAGKSSALRAMKALLYGVDERTSDGFLHGNEQLRVGGRLRLADGRELSFTRRKGRKNTLLAATGEIPIDDVLLVPFLSGVSSSVFSSLFGIDHRALVDGGEQILQQKGEVGSVLFAAALGSRGLQTLLSELEGEAGELYRPSGSKYAVNKGVGEYRDARKEMKDAALAVRDWDAHRRALDEAIRRLDTIDKEMAGLLKDKNAAERLQRILPRVALRRAHLSAIDGMGAVVELSSNFSERHRLLLNRSAVAKAALAVDRRKLDALRTETAAFAPPGRLLDEEGTIHSLYQLLGAYRKAVGDRPSIEGKRQQARNDARDILKRLRPDLTLDDVPALRPTIVAAKRPIQELATRHQAFETAERKGRKALMDKDREIADLQEELGASPDDHETGPLKHAVSEARRGGDLDSQLRDSVRAEAKLERECQDELHALGLWPGPLEAVYALPVPGNETVERNAEAFRLMEERQRSLADERRRATIEMGDAERTLEAMRLAGAVPTELDLIHARTRRDKGWTLVKRAWLEELDVTEEARSYDSERTLSEAYEMTQAAADDVADRLRREADRVVAQAQALARKDQLVRNSEDLKRRESELAAGTLALQRDWNGHWSSCGFVPLSPAEMRTWLIRLANLSTHSRKYGNV